MNIINGKQEYKQQESQRLTLKEFRSAVQDILEPQHDDQFLIRWLKARDYDVIKAEKMIRESFKFRKKIGANSVLTNAYELPEVYRKHPITVSLGFDKEHYPVRLFMGGICDYKGFVSSLKVVDLIKITVYFLESDLKLLQERKKKVEKMEEKTTFILDFQDFTLKHFYDKSVINAGIQLITMYQDNYPETLKAAYLINVPSYFNWVFNIFKPFLNSVTLSKIKIFKTNGWYEEIGHIMDPKQVPAFLGGELTDPDGNTNCTTLINWDSKIDTSYYLKEKEDITTNKDYKSATIAQRSNLQVPVQVANADSILRWFFRTKEYNIRFGLYYRAEDRKRLEELIPMDEVDCQVIPEESEYICKKSGTYVLHFDNSYSWLTAKQLFYKIEVEDLHSIETNNN